MPSMMKEQMECFGSDLFITQAEVPKVLHASSTSCRGQENCPWTGRVWCWFSCIRRWTGGCAPSIRGSNFSASPKRSMPGCWEEKWADCRTLVLGGVLPALLGAWGCQGFCPTSPCMFCGPGEGLWSCPLWCLVGATPGLLSQGHFTRGHSVSAQVEKDFVPPCWH